MRGTDPTNSKWECLREYLEYYYNIKYKEFCGCCVVSSKNRKKNNFN